MHSSRQDVRLLPGSRKQPLFFGMKIAYEEKEKLGVNFQPLRGG
jgi:hypothetical protein